MISLPKDKESQVEMLTGVLRKQATEISQALDKVIGSPQPVDATVAPVTQAVEVPKKLKDKIKTADQMLQTAERVTSRTNLLTRIYFHVQRKMVNVHIADK